MSEEEEEEKQEERVWKFKTNEYLKQFAMDLCDGKIFTSNGLDQHQVRSVFSILALCDPKYLKWLSDNNVWLVYEYMKSAGPMSVNGMPMFLSAQFLNKEEYDRMVPFFNEYKELKENFKKRSKLRMNLYKRIAADVSTTGNNSVELYKHTVILNLYRVVGYSNGQFQNKNYIANATDSGLEYTTDSQPFDKALDEFIRRTPIYNNFEIDWNEFDKDAAKKIQNHIMKSLKCDWCKTVIGDASNYTSLEIMHAHEESGEVIVICNNCFDNINDSVDECSKCNRWIWRNTSKHENIHWVNNEPVCDRCYNK